MRRVQGIHFVGIGGTGMCGIAEILHTQGYNVSGSDIHSSPVLQRLRNLGIPVMIGHQAKAIAHADVVVSSSAIAADNIEIVAAHARQIPVIPRAQMLAELMRNRYGIAVAGTHGKTTTTSLVTSLLHHGGLDPTFVIGGRLNSTQSNARLGSSDILVVEADESDASFLHLQPTISVITNIDVEHMQTYGGNFSELQQVFVQFVHNLPFYGLIVACGDDPPTRELFPRFQRAIISYGFDATCDLYACEPSYQEFRTQFTAVWRKSGKNLPVTLYIPGAHNVLNALAAIAVAQDMKMTDDQIIKGLAAFSGVGRRLERLGTFSGAAAQAVMLVDDYGHHPRELQATTTALRQGFPNKRLVMIFQPHRYSRTQSLYDDFIQVLSTQVDVLILLNIYPAGEAPIAGINSKALARSVRQRGRIDPICLQDTAQLAELLPRLLRTGDILLTQGAGSIGALARQLETAGLFLGGGNIN